MTDTGVATQKASPRPGRALAWSFLNTAVARFGTIAIGIVLARLLGPAQFGTYAVAFVALMAILSFNELGVSLAIVRWQRDPAEIAPTVTTISLAMSAVLTLAAVLVAHPFAAAMGDTGATHLVQLLSICVLVDGAVATPAALLQRNFRQGQRMVADQVNVWVGALVSIGLAVAGVGALSLVIGRLAGAGLSALLFFHFSPLPYRLGFDRRHVRPLLAFGLPLAGASVIVFLVGFVDQIIVGHLLGAAMLGYYVLASNLAAWPVTLFSQPMRNVAPAYFARLQHEPPQMRQGFVTLLRPLMAVALPVCAVVAVTAPHVIAFIYGAAWAPAAAALQWLAVAAAYRIFAELTYDFLVVVGRSHAVLRLQLAWILALIPAVWIGVSHWGLAGAGAALVAVAFGVSLPMYLLQLRTVGLTPRIVAAAVMVPLIPTAATVAMAVLVSGLVRPDLVVLAVCGLLTLGLAAPVALRSWSAVGAMSGALR